MHRFGNLGAISGRHSHVCEDKVKVLGHRHLGSLDRIGGSLYAVSHVLENDFDGIQDHRIIVDHKDGFAHRVTPPWVQAMRSMNVNRHRARAPPARVSHSRSHWPTCTAVLCSTYD